MEKIRIWDGKKSGINIMDPQHCPYSISFLYPDKEFRGLPEYYCSFLINELNPYIDQLQVSYRTKPSRLFNPTCKLIRFFLKRLGSWRIFLVY